MENKKNNELKTSSIIKAGLKSSMKEHKVLWGFGIVILVLIILFSVLAVLFVKGNLTFAIIDKIIPSSIHTDTNEELDIDFYKEVSPEYKASETKIEDDNYIEIYTYYYIDENGEKQYLENGEYHYKDKNGEDQVIYVALGFFYSARDRLNKIVQVFHTILWILGVAVVVLLIVIWYVKDKKRNDQNKPKRLRKAKNKNE